MKNIIITEDQFNDLMENKKQYIGSCEQLRIKRADGSFTKYYKPENEELWHQMIVNAKQIDTDTFVNSVEITTDLRDEDETPLEWVQYIMADDPTSGVYVSTWDGKEVMYLQSGGFEWIFM